MVPQNKESFERRMIVIKDVIRGLGQEVRKG